MKSLKIYLGILLTVILIASCTEHNKTEIKSTYPTVNRVAAEWEPAIGVTIVWPLDLPHKLIIELAKDTRLYTMVPNEEEIVNAKRWFTKWGIDLENVEFIVSEQGLDSWWARDWGAFAVFDSLGNMHLADGQYKYSTPVSTIGCNDSLQFLFTEVDSITGKKKIILTTEDDDTPLDIANYMGYKRTDLPFTFTGGNVFMDGKGTAISTCIIKNENNFIGESEEQFLADAKTFMGINTYNFISNFEHSGIQHIDCYLKMLENNRLLVMQPPTDHSLYQIYEDIVNNELSQLRDSEGKPYEILRLNTARYSEERLAAYSNSLILNKNVYVPLFGIDQDSIALQQWQDAMPGYNIKGFYYNVHEEPILHPRVLIRRADGYGWKDGDALHCRTRAMWDPQMIYISKVNSNINSEGLFSVEANIIDYSKTGLIADHLLVFWREKGSEIWQTSQLIQTNETNKFASSITFSEKAKTIEYYFSATNIAGKTQTNPITAPKGFYSFVID